MNSIDVATILAELKKEHEEEKAKKLKPKKKPKKKREKIIYEYALYKNDEIVLIGSMKEIAEHENITIETARYYSRPSYRKRVGEYGWNSKHVKRYFREEEEKKAEIIEKAKKVVSLYNIGFSVKEAMKII